MPTAVLPSGQTKYVDHNLDVSVALRDQSVKDRVDRLLHQEFDRDQRQLAIRLQGDGGFGPWTFWIVWGSGSDKRSTPPIVLPENEHTPEAILLRIKDELIHLQPTAAT